MKEKFLNSIDSQLIQSLEVLEHIYRDTRYLSSEKIPSTIELKNQLNKIKNNDLINSNPEILKSFRDKEINFERESISLSNIYFSNLIYSMTVFDKFLSNITKIGFNQTKFLQDKYMNKFEEFVKKNKDDKYISMMRRPEKVIEEHGEPYFMKNWSFYEYIFGIQSNKKIFTNSDYINFTSLYIEARERRNLIVHRGDIKQPIADNIYRNSIITGVKKNETKLSILEKKYPGILNDNNEFNLSINDEYITTLISTLYFIICCIYFSLLKETSNINHFFATKSLELLSYEFEELVDMPVKINNFFLKEFAGNNFDNLDEQVIINSILTNDYYFFKKNISDPQKLKNKAVFEKGLIESLSKSKVDKNYFELLKSVLSNDIDKVKDSFLNFKNNSPVLFWDIFTYREYLEDDFLIRRFGHKGNFKEWFINNTGVKYKEFK